MNSHMAIIDTYLHIYHRMGHSGVFFLSLELQQLPTGKVHYIDVDSCWLRLS